jgi:hypothetical protein
VSFAGHHSSLAFRIRPALFHAAVFWLFGLVPSTGAPSVAASTRIPPPWQLVVADAGFIGIVECEMAGGVVAGYRVIESWKGPPPESRITIGLHTDGFGAHYPLVLVGERFLVAASPYMGCLSRPPCPWIAPSHAVPVWWRQMAPDFYAAWPPARVPLTERYLGWTAFVAGRTTTVDSLRHTVRVFLERDPRAIELDALRARSWLAQVKNPAPPCSSRTCRILEGDDLRTVMANLIDYAGESPSAASQVSSILRMRGREEALRQLEYLPAHGNPFVRYPSGPGSVHDVKEYIRARLGHEALELPARYPALAPSEEERKRLVRALSSDTLTSRNSSRGFDEAVQRLSLHDPAVVTEFLLDWECPRDLRIDPSFAYAVASYFAWKCGGDRVKHLSALLGAREPFVRVAGAVYLAFEDENRGREELRKLSELPDDPGVWAALTLARRGERIAVTRLLEVFQRSAAPTIAGAPHRVLQARVWELLSNSAARSGVPFPFSGEDEYDSEAVYGGLIAWWLGNGHRIQMHDPWFESLARERID